MGTLRWLFPQLNCRLHCPSLVTISARLCRPSFNSHAHSKSSSSFATSDLPPPSLIRSLACNSLRTSSSLQPLPATSPGPTSPTDDAQSPYSPTMTDSTGVGATRHGAHSNPSSPRQPSEQQHLAFVAPSDLLRPRNSQRRPSKIADQLGPAYQEQLEALVSGAHVPLADIDNITDLCLHSERSGLS